MTKPKTIDCICLFISCYLVLLVVGRFRCVIGFFLNNEFHYKIQSTNSITNTKYCNIFFNSIFKNAGLCQCSDYKVYNNFPCVFRDLYCHPKSRSSITT